MTRSPKTDPDDMRVNGPKRGEETLDEVAGDAGEGQGVQVPVDGPLGDVHLPGQPSGVPADPGPQERDEPQHSGESHIRHGHTPLQKGSRIIPARVPHASRFRGGDRDFILSLPASCQRRRVCCGYAIP